MTTLPPHDPARWQAVDGSGTPDNTNGMRAFEASCVLANHQAAEINEHTLTDLMVNLLHFSHSKGFDVREIIRCSHRHFLNEAGDLPAEPA